MPVFYEKSSSNKNLFSRTINDDKIILKFVPGQNIQDMCEILL